MLEAMAGVKIRRPKPLKSIVKLQDTQKGTNKTKHRKKDINEELDNATSTSKTKDNGDKISNDLSENEDKIRSIYKDCADVNYRSFFIGETTKALLIYMDGMSNEEEIEDSVLLPLMNEKSTDLQIQSLMTKTVIAPNVKELNTYSDCVRELSLGKPVIFVSQCSTGFSVNLTKWEKRSIEPPQAESVIRGPREGFIEDITVNISLLRRRIRSPKLKIVRLKVGKYSETSVVIAYIDGLAGEDLIEEVKNRVKRIDIDGVLDSGTVEEFIEDHPYSPFPQLLDTERPDVAVANLLEGRVAILVEGSPFTLIAPITFYSLLQASEDYYSRFLIGTSIRWLRYIFLVISLLLPSLYVAVLTFHQEMIPTSLAISIIGSREQVPFPAIVEVLIMEITFEALREAGVRLPKQIGSAISIVGALVIGDAAVSAGIVSPPMVIVVAITGVASFTIPRYSAASTLRMLRFPMVLLAGVLGLLGVMLGIILIIVHLASLRSFGVPYLSPMAPMKPSEMKDVLIRAPLWKMNKRPHFSGNYNKYRQAPNQKPSPSKGGDG
jgi:hypothetical protein